MEDADKLHLLEVCAGSHRLTDTALEYGLQAVALDVPYRVFDDLKHFTNSRWSIILDGVNYPSECLCELEPRLHTPDI